MSGQDIIFRVPCVYIYIYVTHTYTHMCVSNAFYLHFTSTFYLHFVSTCPVKANVKLYLLIVHRTRVSSKP